MPINITRHTKTYALEQIRPCNPQLKDILVRHPVDLVDHTSEDYIADI